MSQNKANLAPQLISLFKTIWWISKMIILSTLQVSIHLSRSSSLSGAVVSTPAAHRHQMTNQYANLKKIMRKTIDTRITRSDSTTFPKSQVITPWIRASLQTKIRSIPRINLCIRTDQGSLANSFQVLFRKKMPKTHLTKIPSAPAIVMPQAIECRQKVGRTGVDKDQEKNQTS